MEGPTMNATTLTRPTGVQSVSKAFRIELPDAERGRSARDLARLEILNARLANPPKPRNGKTAEEARMIDLRERDAIETAPHVKAERDAVLAGLKEAAQLAKDRGETVEEDAVGRLHIRSRDSLQNLANAGKLTAEQVSAGRKLRTCYENRGDGLGSALTNIRTMGTSPTYDNRKAVWAGLKRGEEGILIGQVECAIRVGYFRHHKTAQIIDIGGWREWLSERQVLPHVAMQMLQEVVGHDKAITAFGRSDSVLDRHTRALALALDVADAVIRGR